MFKQVEEEPPLLPTFQSKIEEIRRAEKRQHRAAFKAVFSVAEFIVSPVSWLPVILVVLVTINNLSHNKSLAQSISDYVILDPKSKIGAMHAIDRFTPFIEERRDVEPIVTADITPTELVLNKPSLVKTNTRPDTATETRNSVIVYEVAEGETLSDIAAKYGLRVASIQVENKDLININRLSIGDSLRIPPQDYSQDYINKVLPTAVASTAGAGNRGVVVRETSADRYQDSGQPLFGRPAGALGINGYHSWAIDIPPSGGSDIYASADGVVTEVASGWNGGYGTMVKIDHGSGWETLYAHLSAVKVDAGTQVGKGAVIATMGATGRVYPQGAVHLHFEIRKNGSRLNPINFVQ